MGLGGVAWGVVLWSVRGDVTEEARYTYYAETSSITVIAGYLITIVSAPGTLCANVQKSTGLSRF